MHIRRRTRPAKDTAASQVRRPPPPALRLSSVPPNRFAATVNAAQAEPRPDVAAYQKGYRDSAERSHALLTELAHALEEAMSVGWPDDTEPRNAEWRRLVWRARRTPK